MKVQTSMSGLLTIIFLIVSLILCKPANAYDNPNLLPNNSTPVIDLAKSLTTGETVKLEEELNTYEKDSGWKIRVLTQYENTPGLAIKDFWNIDERTLLLLSLIHI